MNKPVTSLGGLVPRLNMRHRASSRRREFVETRGCLICGAGNAGPGEIGVGFFGAWWLYGGSKEHGDLRGMDCGVWPARCGIADFAVFCELPEGG